MQSIVEETVSALRTKFFRSKEVDLIVSYNRDSLSPSYIFPGELRKSFENLLENALDAVKFGGLIQIKISQRGPHCFVDFEDNGCGVPSSFVPKLFEKSATFGKVNGTGLGLFHTRQVLEEMGGGITYFPLEQGTRFEISLPLAQVGVSYVGLPGNERLAVIDDQTIVADTLANSGYSIEAKALTYNEGKTLLRKIPGGDALMILVDQRLGPNELGTDLIAECGTRPGMLLCTNDFDDLDVIRRARQVGVKILPKPLCFLSQSPLKKSTISSVKA